MKYINLHTHSATNDSEILEVVNQYPRTFDDAVKTFSIGIHPWYIEEEQVETDLNIIEQKLQLENCVALGECGLDKRIEIPFQLQQRVFELQLAIAEKFQKPVVIHCVAAFQELIAIKKKLNINVPMVIHGFSKNEQTAKQLLDNGFYLSFGKYLLRNPELEYVFKSVSNDRFFLETDTAEEGIKQVYELAAKYKNTSVDQISEIVNANFAKCLIGS